jgi:hypothetical protein
VSGRGRVGGSYEFRLDVSDFPSWRTGNYTAVSTQLFSKIEQI